MSRLKQLIHEVHRRSLWQVLGIYVLGGWIALQIVDTLAGALKLPDWAAPIALVLLIIGLPIVLATAFVQEGIGSRADGEVETTSGGTPIPSSATKAGTNRLLTWRNALAGGVVAFALWGLVSAVWVLLDLRSPTEALGLGDALAEPATPAIAVMPFTIRGDGLDVWREGMVDVLSTNLANVVGLRAINSRTVLARWKEEIGEGEEADLAVVLSVAERAGAHYALMGNAIVTGPSVRFSADLFDVDSRRQLEHVQVEGSLDEVFGLVDDLSLDVVRAIVSGGTDLPHFDLAGVTTTSLAALKAFLIGESFYRRSDFEAAIESYEEAVAIDSTFALAYHRLADSYGYVPTSGTGRNEALERARKYENSLPERERVLLMALEDQFNGDLETFEALRAFLQRHPSDAQAWFYLGELYYHAGGRVLATAEETQEAFARAVALAPEFAPPYLHHIALTNMLRADSAHSAKLLADYLKVGVDRGLQLSTDLIFGNPTTRRQSLASLDTVSRNEVNELVLFDLSDPRYWDVLEPVLLTMYRRSDESANPDEWRSVASWRLATGAALNAGQLNKALAYLEEMEPHWRRPCAIAMIVVGELPVPAEFQLTTLRLETENSDPSFCIGLIAAAQGRWDVHAEALGNLREWAADSRADEDSAGADNLETLARIAEAYGLRGRGNSAAALRVLESDPETLLEVNGRWLRASLYMEQGRPADAIPILRSIWPAPVADRKFVALASRELGRAYEALGENEKAIAAYAKFIEAWQNADPALQLWVDEAQARMDALWAKHN